MIPASQTPHAAVGARSDPSSAEGSQQVNGRGSTVRTSVSAVVAASVRLYLDGLALALEQRGGIRVIARASTVEAVLAAASRLGPDVVLLDISMQGAFEGIQRLSAEPEPRKVIAFAVDDDHDDLLLACAEAGVAGWVGRNGSLDEVVEAIRSAGRGELACSTRLAALMARRLAALTRDQAVVPAVNPLTPREAEIAELLREGMSNKQIARTLSLQLATVKNHVHSILTKLGATSRAEAGARLRAAGSANGARGSRPLPHPDPGDR
jgi:two-component system, NarL family, nitrate/nitrite response regulator NarL